MSIGTDNEGPSLRKFLTRSASVLGLSSVIFGAGVAYVQNQFMNQESVLRLPPWDPEAPGLDKMDMIQLAAGTVIGGLVVLVIAALASRR